MEKRYFDNTFSDSTSNIENVIANNKPKYNEKLMQYIETKWKNHFKNYTDNEDYSIYTGSSGIALLKFLRSNNVQNKTELLKEAKELLPIHLLNNRRVTFMCGDAGPLALAAIIEYQLGNHKQSQTLIERLVNMSIDVLNEKSTLPNELLYGRCGYLFALLYVNKNINNEPIKAVLIKEVIKTILLLGQKEAKGMKLTSPLMYSWHNKHYLGAAHGLAGILFTILQAQEYVDKTDLNNLKSSIDFLASMQFHSGNFPSSLGNDNDKLVQWCHGAPGYVNLFCLAYKTFKDEKYLQLALQCGEVVWKKGLLTKGYSICHGVAGNAYTFLTLFKFTHDAKHLYRACKFAEWCVDYTANHEYHYPDRPYSLYEGLAGQLYLLIDIQDPLNAKFPAYEL